MITIVPIVEGHGEVISLPTLLRNVLHNHLSRYDVRIGKPVRAKGRQDLELRLDVHLSHATDRNSCDGILVVLDADNDCPVDAATDLKAAAIASGVSVPVEIVYTHHTYEAWFLASIESLRGERDISESAVFQGDPDMVPNPKEWLRRHMQQGIAYKETTHQPTLTRRIDITLAHARSRSFRRLCHAVEQLIEEIEALAP